MRARRDRPLCPPPAATGWCSTPSDVSANLRCPGLVSSLESQSLEVGRETSAKEGSAMGRHLGRRAFLGGSVAACWATSGGSSLSAGGAENRRETYTYKTVGD